MAKEIRRYYAEIVIETDASDMPRMSSWVNSRLRSAVDMSDHGMVAIAIFDEKEVMVGQSVVGQPETVSPADLFREAS